MVARVNDRDRGIGARSLLQHHVGDRFAHDVGASDHHHLGAVGFHSRPHDHFLNPGRRTGREFDLGAADHQAPHVDRMEAVHVFVRIDGIEHFFFIDVFGQRKLNQNAVYGVILVVLVNQCQKIRFAEMARLIVLNLFESEAFGGLDLERHIGNGGRILPDQDGHQAGNDPVLLP